MKIEQCPRLLNEYHGPGPGSGLGVHHDVTFRCLGVKDHPGRHQFEDKKPCTR